MVTQKIVTRLSNDVLPPVRMVSGDVGREIQLEIYANDESLAPIDLETYSARITIIKPDKTFVIQDFDNDKVELPEQAGAVTGHGYYQIKIYTAGDHQIYTGQGPFIVDDDVLSEEMIESVAEVNGYEFPDDFLTDADLREYVTKHELEDALAGIIDDDTTDYNSTWSSAKISESLSSVAKTATGNPIEFTDGADAPLVKCVTQITGYQSGSGTPSPDNICPITAYTEGEIEVRGKNALNNADAEIGTAWNGGSNSARARLVVKKDPYTPYVISMNGTNGMEAIYVKRYSSVPASDAGTQITSFPVTIPATDDNTFLIFAFSKTAISQTDVDNLKLQVEKGSTPTTYEPYKGTTHTTTYPSAIYRGSEDCVKGEVTEEYAYINLGSLTWQRLASQTEGIYRFAATDASIKIPDIIGNYQIVDGVCDSFPMVDVNHIVTGNAANGSIAVALNPNIQIRYDEITDVATLTTFLRDKYIAYKLKTPTTSPVTPTNLPIKSLSGYNHIESSTGEMEVKYITQTYDAIMEATKLDNMKVYRTAEQVVGKWVDGSDLKEKTYIYTGTGVANPFTTTIDFTGKSIIEVIQHYVKFTYGSGTVGYCAGSALVNNNSNLMNVAYDDNTPPTVRVTCYIGSGTETYEVAFTIRYI